MAVTRTCDLCKVATKDTERYSLQYQRRLRLDLPDELGAPRNNSLSMGGMDMCKACWRNLPKVRERNDWHRCDMIGCRTDVDVLLLGLKASVRVGKTVRTRGRGSIALCIGHWEKVALPHMRKHADRQTDATRVFLLNARRAR